MRYIYLVTNTIDNKVYVGQHTYHEKKRGLDPYYFCSSCNPEFWEDVKKYENIPDNISNLYDYCRKNYQLFKYFKVELIQYCFSKDALDVMESMWITYYRRTLGRDKVYNIHSGGNGWGICI